MTTTDIKSSPDRPARLRDLFRRRSSIAWRIGIVYALLASANLVFFIVLLFENQSEIMMQLFRFRSHSIVDTIRNDMQGRIEADTQAQFVERLSDIVARYEVKSLVLADETGEILHAEPALADPELSEKELRRSIASLTRSESLLDSNSLVKLNEKDFSIEFLIPVRSQNRGLYVQATISVAAMHEQLKQVYIQSVIVLIWVFLLHLGFAIYLFRQVVRRVSRLKEVSRRMTDGDLSARADWRFTRADELDDLGETFNTMAASIEKNTQTIQSLNRQIEKELIIGKNVQSLIINNQNMLPEYNPFIYYRPLRQVSGDVFKSYELSRTVKGLFFGDACGHGVSAALITSLAVASVDRLIRKEPHPGKILNGLARELHRSLEGMYYTTACLLLFDAKSKRLYLSNAGHPPPIILRPSNGHWTAIEASGPPAGTIPDFLYRTQAVDLKAGDRVVLYSDGVIEAQSPEKEAYSLERLIAMLRRNARVDGHSVGRKIVQDLELFSPQFHDDVSLIQLEVP